MSNNAVLWFSIVITDAIRLLPWIIVLRNAQSNEFFFSFHFIYFGFCVCNDLFYALWMHSGFWIHRWIYLIAHVLFQTPMRRFIHFLRLISLFSISSFHSLEFKLLHFFNTVGNESHSFSYRLKNCFGQNGKWPSLSVHLFFTFMNYFRPLIISINANICILSLVMTLVVSPITHNDNVSHGMQK